MSNKSLITRLVSEHADGLAIKLRNFDQLAESLDKNFEAEADEQGNVTITRKGTQQVITDSFESFFRLVARNHVDDLSFGRFRSQFKPRDTTPEERSKVKALLDYTQFHFTDNDKRSKLEGFIMQHFVPDGNKLRRFHNGMVSETAYEPESLLAQYGDSIVDKDRSELARLEQQAIMRDKAAWLLPDNPERAEKMLQATNHPMFETLPPDTFERQRKDHEAKAMTHIGVLSRSELTERERNAMEIKAKFFAKELETLPTKPTGL